MFEYSADGTRRAPATLSRLMLGTVQFGLPYGIANRTGQPSFRDVKEILAAAFAGGVNCLDTAAEYGESEEVIGRALAELDASADVTVVTKVRPVADEIKNDPAAVRKAIEASVVRSLSRLRLDSLPLVLFHREDDARYLADLRTLVDRGLVQRVGVSCGNDPDLALKLATENLVDAVQVPTNLLDARHRQSGLLPAAAAAGMAVFVRSVLLQGLLAMDSESIPTPLAAVIPVRQKFSDIGREAGLSVTELAVRFVLGLPAVTSLVVGVETLPQLSDNLALFARGPLPADVVSSIESVEHDLPWEVLTPSLW